MAVKEKKAELFEGFYFLKAFIFLIWNMDVVTKFFFFFLFFFFTVAIFQLEPQIELNLDGHQLIVEETGLRI